MWEKNIKKFSIIMTFSTKYGLPSNVFSVKCVMSNQKPHSVNETTHTAKSKKTTLGFDEEGVCDACKYAEEKDNKINWEERKTTFNNA